MSDALDIAEDVTGNYYKFSMAQWKRHRYDVRTLSALTRKEIRPRVFALLNKTANTVSDDPGMMIRNRDFYFICLQDHRILHALKKDRQLGLLSLLVYIFTHELVHIVRFCSFKQRFDLPETKKKTEEKIVHAKTFEILKDVPVPKLDYILDSYRGHRICETAVTGFSQDYAVSGKPAFPVV